MLPSSVSPEPESGIAHTLHAAQPVLPLPLHTTSRTAPSSLLTPGLDVTAISLRNELRRTRAMSFSTNRLQSLLSNTITSHAKAFVFSVPQHVLSVRR